MLTRILRSSLRRCSSPSYSRSLLSSSSSSSTPFSARKLNHPVHENQKFHFSPPPSFLVPSANVSSSFYSTSSDIRRYIGTQASASEDTDDFGEDLTDQTDEEGHATDEWEEEEEAEPKVGDGGDGGGVVLQNVPWGEHALSVARDVLSKFSNDIELFAFKTTPRGYIYVRIDKLSNKYGCPSMEEIESYSQEYKKRLDEAGAAGIIPDNLALEVSSPGAERLLKVPDELPRFQDMPMRVCYVEEGGCSPQEKSGVFYVDSVDRDADQCVWKLADVRENRDPQSKGRLLSRKQKDWRLKLPYANCRKVTLYLDF